MRKKWVWLLALVLVVGGLAAVNAMKLGSKMTVELRAAEPGVVAESVFANGRFAPALERTVYAERSARVHAVFVKPGDAVEAGDPLFEYDADEWIRRLTDVRNQLDIANAQRDIERKRNFESARAQTDPGEAEKLVEAEESARQLHHYQTASLQNEAALLQQNVDERTVFAEESGVVASVSLDAGARAQEGMEALRLADVSQLVVKASLIELDAGKVKPGMKAIVTGDAFEERFEAELTYVSPVARPATADGLDYEVEIEATLPRGAVAPDVAKPGFAATLEFALPGEERALVPIDAIQYEGSDVFVYGVSEGVATRIPVTVGKDDGERIEVLSGLAAGDEYVYPVPKELREGEPVEAREAE
jgi:RND family efflux transporter MFP subunit